MSVRRTHAPVSKSMIADHIVHEIIDDILDRKGLGDEWEAIDEDAQDEIKEAWRKIILLHIAPV
jgi:hypothetical protein